jgi:hypothetical protein
MSKDSQGSTYDDQGRNYVSNSGSEARHGDNVRVNDGYGNMVPGHMNYGTAVPNTDS